MRDPHIISRDFARILLRWDRQSNSREMPWKGEKDPFKVWISEIILQQTRVEQGLAYYNRFIDAFPDVDSLAKAPEAQVFKYWEGLGYYSRCRNLIATAKYISGELQGRFPDAYEDIQALKGIGPYTAAAISSFAFDLPHAVVDGNVFRVLSRIFGITIPVDSTEGKKHFTVLANRIMDKKHPALYNQAIMDFGATICKPAPVCDQCPFQKHCVAFLDNKINQLPVKEKKNRIKKRWFYYLVIKKGDQIAIRQRTGKDIWRQLYEFPMVEMNSEQAIDIVLSESEKKLLATRKYETAFVSPVYKQQLSHQLIAGQFIEISLKDKLAVKNDWIWVDKSTVNEYAFPKLINQYLPAFKL